MKSKTVLSLVSDDPPIPDASTATQETPAHKRKRGPKKTGFSGVKMSDRRYIVTNGTFTRIDDLPHEKRILTRYHYNSTIRRRAAKTEHKNAIRAEIRSRFGEK